MARVSPLFGGVHIALILVLVLFRSPVSHAEAEPEADPKPDADPQYFISPNAPSFLNPFGQYIHPAGLPQPAPISTGNFHQGVYFPSRGSGAQHPNAHQIHVPLPAFPNPVNPVPNVGYKWHPFRILFTPNQLPQIPANPSANPVRNLILPLFFQPRPPKSDSDDDRYVFGMHEQRIVDECYRDGVLGTCAYSPTECQRRNGTANQYCPNFQKVCCTFNAYECNSIVSGEVVHIHNMMYSNPDELSEPCAYSINTMDSYCSMNVLFKTFSISGPEDCSKAGLNVVGVPGNFKTLCNVGKNKIYQIPISNAQQVILNFDFKEKRQVLYNIEVTQIPCGTTNAEEMWPSEGTSTSKKKPQEGEETPTDEAGSSTDSLNEPKAPEMTEEKKPEPVAAETEQAKPKTVQFSCGQSRKFSKRPKPRSDAPFSEEYYKNLESQISCYGESCPVERRTNPLLQTDWWSVPTVAESELYQNAGQFNPIDARITFGKKTKQFDYPWQVAMYVSGRFHCGASVISKREILTAAHCVRRYRNRPRVVNLSVGDYNVKSQTDGKNINPKVQKIIVHPGYSTSSLKNDIAIIRLEEPLTFSERVHAVCLPKENIKLDNEVVTVTGWGRDENNLLQPILMEHSAAVVSNRECNKRWRSKGLGRNIIQSTMMCMDPQTGDSCKGDSGGPSVVNYPKGSNKFTIVGVVSFGSSSCTDKRLPGVYTRVGSMLPWISKNLTPN